MRHDLTAGSVYIFTDSSGTWARVAELTGSDRFHATASAPGGDRRDEQHRRRARPRQDCRQRLRVHRRRRPVDAGIGTEPALYAAATSGTRLPFGSDRHRRRSSGSSPVRNAFVFNGTGTAWTQAATLLEPVPATRAHDFGSAVAVDGSTAVVGAWIATKGAARHTRFPSACPL